MKYFVITIISALICNININAQNYSALPQDTKYETDITEPITLRKGCWQSGLSYSYSPFTDRFLENGERSYLSVVNNSDGIWYFSGCSIVDHDLGFNLSYGITNSLQLNISIPYGFSELICLYEIEDISDNNIENTSIITRTKGFGDVSTSLNYLIINKPTCYSAIYLGASWPLEENSIKCSVNFKKIYYPFSLTYSAGGGLLIENKSYVLVQHIGVGILLNSWFSIGNSWGYSYLNYAVRSSSGNYISTDFKITQQVKRFRFNESITFPVAGHNAVANMNLSFSTSFKF